MTVATENQLSSLDARETAAQWLNDLQIALENRDAAGVQKLFAANSTFRDLLAFSWDFRSYVGAKQIAEGLTSGENPAAPKNLRVRPGSEPALSVQGADTFATAFFEFDTKGGQAEGFAQLKIVEGQGPEAIGVVVQMRELEGHPESIGPNRPVGKEHGPVVGRKHWGETRDPNFENEEPRVVIIGGGHNGLMAAARLATLGIRALVVEKNPRVGDNWRNYYSSLALHDPIGVDHLPYMPLPSTWPNYTPKDKFGDYLEAYATLLDLDVWTGSKASDVEYLEDEQKWSLRVTRADGEVRDFKPNHVIIATGQNQIPTRPEIPGEESFVGEVYHSSEFPDGSAYHGKKAIVIGTGVSGHDVAQDLAERGIDVTMIQRSPTVVVDASTWNALSFSSYMEDGPATEDADLMNAMVPFGVFPSLGADHMAAVQQMDKDLHQALRERTNFQLSDGIDGEGLLGIVFRQNKAGYYKNIGASELIIEGKIKVEQGEVTKFHEHGIELNNGSVLDADVVIFATGYKSVEDAARPLLGDEVVDSLGNFSEVAEDLEYRGLWRRSGKQGLWFMVSMGIFYGRFYSKLLALQIKAIEEGIAPRENLYP